MAKAKILKALGALATTVADGAAITEKVSWKNITLDEGAPVTLASLQQAWDEVEQTYYGFCYIRNGVRYAAGALIDTLAPLLGSIQTEELLTYAIRYMDYDLYSFFVMVGPQKAIRTYSEGGRVIGLAMEPDLAHYMEDIWDAVRFKDVLEIAPAATIGKIIGVDFSPI